MYCCSSHALSEPPKGLILLAFLVRRSAHSFLVVSGSFALIYSLAATIGDPLAEIRLSNPPNLEYLLLAASRELRLDQSIPERFIAWYWDVLRSLISGKFSLGEGLNGRPVTEGLLAAISPTFFLVTFSILLTLLIGSSLGVLAAVSHRSAKEAFLNLLAFLGYVAPVFWIGHLFKQFAVIRLNDVVASTLTWSSVFAYFIGSIIFIVFSILSYLNLYSWSQSSLRKKLLFGLLVALGLMAPGQLFLNDISSFWQLALFAFATAGVFSICWALIARGFPKRFNFGFQMGVYWVVSLCLQKLALLFPGYTKRDEISGRPFPSFAIESVWYSEPGFWILQIDRIMHVLLPAFAISLTTVAIYYQVTKSAALDALESDYVKMARAKGLNELEVLVRHVFRSCYLSLSNTFVPNYLYLFNGIVIIELVFGWQGIGIYLMDSIFNYDLNRLMGGVFVLGVFTFFMMLLSDLISNRLDPRIAEFR
ncbi:MAG: hypothetical protein RLZZ320_50 [Actinomycetota bacterium]